MKDWRNKIKLAGNLARSESFIGPAQSQMEILKSEMKLRGLSQGVRRVWLHDDVYVKCNVCFNQLTCNIWTPPVPDLAVEELEVETTYLLVITGDETRKVILNSVVGTFEAGEAVTCGDDGYGTITSVSEVFSGSQTLYGSFVHCYATNILVGETSHASGVIELCYRRHFQDFQGYEEIIGNVLSDRETNLLISSAYDISPVGNIACSNITTLVFDEWSKVYDDLVLTVYTYIEFGVHINTMWAAVASYKGSPLTFLSFGQYPVTGFERTKLVNLDTISLHIGFDVWRDEEDNYCIGLMNDGGSFVSFKLNQADRNFELLASARSNVRGEKYVYPGIPDWSIKYVRLLGYGHILEEEIEYDVAYWGAPNRSHLYYQENLTSGEITEFDIGDPLSDTEGDLVAAIWNPLLKTLHVQAESDGASGGLTIGHEFIATFTSYCVAWAGSGFVCYFNQDGTLISGSWSCGDLDSAPSTQTCPIKYTIDGITYEYTAFCGIKPKWPNSYYWDTNFKCVIKTQTDSTYFGRVLIETSRLSKGHTVNFSVKNGSALFVSYTTGSPCCSDGVWFDPDSNPSTTECRPYRAKRYDFQKWMFGFGGLSYSYLVDDKTTEVADSNIACVWENAWSEETVGNDQILKAANDVFPYDSGWSSILIHGTDREGNEHENWIIYKDLIDGGFFVMTDTGKKYDIGSYDRAFFTLHTEEEVING